MKEHGGQNRGLLAGFSPLAGVSAGTAAVLFAFGVLALAWHRVSWQVSMAITVLMWGLVLAVLFYVFLWLRHRVRYPETLARGWWSYRRQLDPAVAPDAAVRTVNQSLHPNVPAAIEPPRVYLNVTDDQLAAIMRQHTEGNRP